MGLQKIILFKDRIILIFEHIKNLFLSLFQHFKVFKSLNLYIQLKNWVRNNKAHFNSKQDLRFLTIDNRYFAANQLIKVIYIILIRKVKYSALFLKN